MKLYTEEQLINTVNSIQIYIEKFGKDGAQPTIKNHLKMLAPIELPSDVDIEQECNKLPYEKHVDCGMYNDGQIDGFELGARWMNEQILKQDKQLMKTPMTLLFEEFESLSSASRKAGDEQTSNLIDFLCERKKIALEEEKEHIIAAANFLPHDEQNEIKTPEEYYNNKYQTK